MFAKHGYNGMYRLALKKLEYTNVTTLLIY